MVRFKHRYFTVEVIPTHKPASHSFSLNPHELTKGVLNCIQELHGDFGVAAVMSGFKAKYCNPVTRLGVIRSRHGPHRLVSSSLPLVRSLHKTPVMIRTLYTGASLKQCFLFAVNHQKKELMKMWNSLRNEEARDALKKSIFDLSAFQEIESNLRVPVKFGGKSFLAEQAGEVEDD